jgi:hypothetical protein
MGNAKTFLALILFLAIGCAAALVAGRALTAPAPFPAEVSPLSPDESGGEHLPTGRGCTTVYATDGVQMLGGNNEDFVDPLTKVSFVPASEGTFGRVYFGYENWWTEGGMNDQGLFFDGLAVGIEVPVVREGKQLYGGTSFIDYVMARCATVACVVEMYETYYTEETWAWQHLFGDATGESVIIEPQEMLRQRGGYQVVTNFYQSTTPPEERDCWRFDTATQMLEGSPALSVEYMRDVMAAVHQPGPGSRTLYTNVYDLANRIVYLYYYHDYEHVVVIDLEEELAKGSHSYDVGGLFPPNPRAEQFNVPILRQYNDLIESRLVEVEPAVLAAYVGDYEAPEEWAGPDQWIHVVPHGDTLMMIRPDSHRNELFPQSETSFFAITWAGKPYEVWFDANFGVDADGQVLYLELDYGDGQMTRHKRLDAEQVVQDVATPAPTDTPVPTHTPRPTATAERTPVPATAVPPMPGANPGFQWGWAIPPVALLAAAAGWLVIRRRRSARR